MLTTPPGAARTLVGTVAGDANIDPAFTDISAGLALARALPLGGGQRVVLISDGAENLGSAITEAAQAAAALPSQDAGEASGRVPSMAVIAQNLEVAPTGSFSVYLRIADAPSGSDVAVDIYDPIADAADLAVIMLTLVLPFMAAFLHVFTGGDPTVFTNSTDYTNQTMIVRLAIFVAACVLASIGI